MGRKANELVDAAHGALRELRRIEWSLERTVDDTSDKHLAGRIYEALVRVHDVAEALAHELDRQRPSRSLLRRHLEAGSIAVGLVGLAGGIVFDDISDRIDTVDVAGELIEGVLDIVSGQREEISEAVAAYFVEQQRFETALKTEYAQVSFRGGASLDLGDPQVIDGGNAAGDEFDGVIDGGRADSTFDDADTLDGGGAAGNRYPGYRDGYGPVRGDVLADSNAESVLDHDGDPLLDGGPLTSTENR
jgi:hypothetical protein